jgi:hypothetical protein
MYLRNVDSLPLGNTSEKAPVCKMGKRHFVAVYTDSGCIVGCGHTHQNVATATACVSQPGGYIVAVRRRKYLQLTDDEEAEFQKLMFGRTDQERSCASDVSLLHPVRSQE